MYPGSVRKRHSSTHQSEQNVSLPWGTSRLHQRHRLRPFAPLGRRLRSAHPPGIVRMVLMDRLCVSAQGSCQRNVRWRPVFARFFLTSDGTRVHWYTSNVKGTCSAARIRIYSAIAPTSSLRVLGAMLRLGIQLAKVNLTTRTGRRRVFFQPSKYLFALAITSVFGLAPLRMVAQEPAPAPAAAQGPQWKNQAEFDLFTAITKETDPKAKLAKIQQWEKDFPDTAFMAQRRTLLLTTYFQLGQAQQAVDVAKQILAVTPNDFSALYITVTLTQSLAGQSPTPDVLDQGEKAATALLNVNDAPATLTAAQWATQKPQVQNLAHTTLAWIQLQRKNYPAAEGEYQKSLQINPNNGTIDFQLATAIYSEKDPAKTPTALFYFARAATYDGQDALTPDGRKTVMAYVQRAYKGYHGSDEGFNNLLAAAKASPAPPADFTIKNALDIAKAEMANEEEWTKNHPQEALWKGIKVALTGA